MANPLIAALEIGTSRTVVCVGESDRGGRMTITGVGTYPTTGVRKGQIIDLAQARVGVEAAVKQAEKMSDVNIWQVLLGLSGGHIQGLPNVGRVTIRNSDRIVTREDIDAVNEIAGEVPVDPERQVLHTIKQTYELDDQLGIIKPEGMRCNMLALNMLAIHGQKNRVENVVSVAKSAQLEVSDVAFSGICAGLAVLTPEQKKNGVVVVDLGGGTTNYVAYSNNVVSGVGSIGIGGDHVTNDIALAFNIQLSRAEELKRSDGSALVESDSATRRITLAADVGFEERVISCRALHTVINARMDETLHVLRSRLDESGILPHLGSGIVLTGGGAYLKKLTDLTERVTGLPCRVGVPVNVVGLDAFEQPAAFATAAGLVMYGHLTYEDNGFFSPLRKLLKVFKS